MIVIAAIRRLVELGLKANAAKSGA